MATASIGEITATLKLRDQLTPQLKVATNEVQKFGPEIQAAGAQASGLDRALKGAGVAFGVLAAGAAAAGAAIVTVTTAIVKLGERGSVVAGVAESFESLARSVGETSTSLLEAGRSGTRGLVSDLQLMEAANKAILLGLPITNDEFQTLGQTAIALGRAMKLGPEQSINDLVTALGRSSPLILDNLGLTVKAGEANEKYASSLGKTVEQLTDSERKMAFYAAAMEAARNKVAELGEAQLTFGDHLQRGRVFLTNTLDELGRLVATSPVITTGMAEVARALSSAFGGQTQDLIQLTTRLIEHAAIAMVSFGSLGAQAAKVVGLAFFGLLPTIEKYLAVLAAVNLAASRLPGVGRAAESTGQALLSLTAIVSELKGNGEAFGASMDALADGLAEAAKQMRANLGATRQAQAGMSNFRRETDRAGESVGGTAGKVRDLNDLLTDFDKAIAKPREAVRDLAREMELAFQPIAIAHAFDEMAALVSDDIYGIIDATKDLAVELDAIPEKVGVAWTDVFGGIADSMARLSQIAGDLFGDISRGFGLAVAGASDFLKGLDEIKTGGLQGLVAGIGSMVNALTAGVQAAITLGRALKDAFTRSEAEKAAADIRRTLGLDVSEDDPLVKAIEALVKSGRVNRNEAIALNLDELLQQAGGVTAANFDTFLSRSVELFDLIGRGGEIGAMALESLDTILGDLGAHVVAQGGLWDEYFIAVLQRAQAEGLELASVMALLDGEMSKVATGLESIVSAGAGDQASFDRLSRVAFASFNAFIAQGKSAVEAIDLVGPSIDRLIAQAEEMGFTSSEAFAEMQRWRDLVNSNRDLLNSITGLNDVLTGLANLGGLTVETFQDLQAQGVQTFNDLVEAGFSEQEALAQMAPFLETLIELHKKRGLVIDDETQALINQAAEQGLLSEEAISTNDILMTGLQGIADLFGQIFGVEVPRLFQGMVDEGQKAADGLSNAFRSIDFTVPGLSIPKIPGFDTDNIPQLAEGGIVRRPTLAVVGEKGAEAIVPLSQLGSMGGGPTIYVTLNATVADDEAFQRFAGQMLPAIAREVQRGGLTRVG